MDTINYSQTDVTESPKRGNWALWFVGGLAIALAGVSGYEFYRIEQLEQKMASMSAVTQNDLAAIRESTSSTAMAMRSTVDALGQQLEAKTTQATASYQKTLANAKMHAEKLVKQVNEQSKANQERFNAELGEVRSAANANAEKVTGLESNLGTVKTEVTETRSMLDGAVGDLKSVRGDLGVQSGLIATNAKELAALRELGERNYYEFTINRKNTPTKVGNITLALKKADLKRNKFNVEVVADDKRVEKKDKTINEPVQFYVSGARMPYELVINEVGKDKIVGYLATPKVMTARR
jgi:chromosome segregation ATPase